MKIYAYRNLHKNCFSIKMKNKVIAYETILCLKNAEFVVWQSGFKKFQKENRKNVHAFVKGEIITEFDKNKFKTEIIYNPKINNYFFYKKSNEKIINSDLVLLINGKIFIK